MVFAPDKLRGSWRYPNGAGLDFDEKTYRVVSSAGETVDKGQFSVDGDVITMS